VPFGRDRRDLIPDTVSLGPHGIPRVLEPQHVRTGLHFHGQAANLTRFDGRRVRARPLAQNGAVHLEPDLRTEIDVAGPHAARIQKPVRDARIERQRLDNPASQPQPLARRDAVPRLRDRRPLTQPTRCLPIQRIAVDREAHVFPAGPNFHRAPVRGAFAASCRDVRREDAPQHVGTGHSGRNQHARFPLLHKTVSLRLADRATRIDQQKSQQSRGRAIHAKNLAQFPSPLVQLRSVALCTTMRGRILFCWPILNRSLNASEETPLLLLAARRYVLRQSQVFAACDDLVGRASWPAADPLVGLLGRG